MEYDLQIHTEDTARLWAELDHVVEFFRGLGHERCDVYFGWAWTIDRDKPDLSWKEATIPLTELHTEIKKAEDAELGRFAGDDAWLNFEGENLEFQFCHHDGVHLFYSEPGGITNYFQARWRDEGLEPEVFERADEKATWQPARDDLV
jgi:hypothetical protein